MIEIESHRAEDFRAFEGRTVADREEVDGVLGLGGGFDYPPAGGGRVTSTPTSDFIDGMLSSQIGP